MYQINVINRHTTDVNTLPKGTVSDIMQSHRAILGNPFYNRTDMTLEQRVKAFETHLWETLPIPGAIHNELGRLYGLLLQGKTINLVCVCAPNPCHGDVIKRCLLWMLNQNHTYTGVGARATPLDILTLMERIAFKYSTMGGTLRSGGAVGADTAFEKGATLKQIYYAKHATPEAMAIAERYHGGWNYMQDWGRRLHGRNAFQVLGPNLNEPSDLLICWTADGCVDHGSRTRNTGGTGTAISIASMYFTTVYNLARPEHHAQWLAWVV